MNGDKYYGWVRDDLLSLLPDHVKIDNALDVGCGVGKTGELLKTDFGVQNVVGIELQSEIAQKAENVLDKVYNISADAEILPFKEKQFDLILMADVLEHLVDPWNTLERYRSFLKPDGYLLASIPNVQHFKTLFKLFAGRWEYKDGGTLDKTHLRFFTYRSIKQMFHNAGFERIVIKSKMGLELKIINFITLKSFKGLLAYQFLISSNIY